MNVFNYLLNLSEEELINLLCDYYKEYIESPIYFTRSNTSIRSSKNKKNIILQTEKYPSSILLEINEPLGVYGRSLLGNVEVNEGFEKLKVFIRKRKITKL